MTLCARLYALCQYALKTPVKSKKETRLIVDHHFTLSVIPAGKKEKGKSILEDSREPAGRQTGLRIIEKISED